MCTIEDKMIIAQSAAADNTSPKAPIKERNTQIDGTADILMFISYPINPVNHHSFILLICTPILITHTHHKL